MAKQQREPVHQLNIRVDKDFLERLRWAAKALHTDTAHLARMILAKGLPAVEREARALQAEERAAEANGEAD